MRRTEKTRAPSKLSSVAQQKRKTSNKNPEKQKKMSNTKPSDDGGTNDEPSKSKEKSRKATSAKTKTSTQPKRRNSTVNFNTQVLVGVAPTYDRKIAVRLNYFYGHFQKNV